jgi:hypothetical protein
MNVRNRPVVAFLHHLHMNDPRPRAEREVVTVTEAALALAGHELEPFTYELISKMGHSELTGDQCADLDVCSVWLDLRSDDNSRPTCTNNVCTRG